jgi:micrococcal nuclease
MKTGLIVLSMLLLLAGCGEEEDLGISAQSVEARVISITDGDTIKVLFRDEEYDVRYIGINTPEIPHGDSPGEECGMQATDANRALVAGQTVRLERDVSDKDGFGRFLRYVYIGDLMVNEMLVRAGWAEVVSYPPDTREFENFKELEQEAAAVNVGCHAFEIFDDGTYER